MHHHIDVVIVRPEQVMGLNHLQALVHHRRAVDRDLRAHVPVRVRRRLRAHPLGFIFALVGELRGREVAEGAAARREDDFPHAVRRHALQGLEDGAMFTIGGRHGRAVLFEEREDGRAAGDQSLLVREGDVLAGLDGGHGRRQPRGAHDARHHNIGALRRGAGRRRVGAAVDFEGRAVDARGLQSLLQGLELGPVGDADGRHGPPELGDLRREELVVGPGAERDDREPVGPRAAEVQRLRADGARRAEHGDGPVPVRVLHGLVHALAQRDLVEDRRGLRVRDRLLLGVYPDVAAVRDVDGTQRRRAAQRRLAVQQC